MTIEMEALADKICKEELGQEPNETNLAFRKTLVHGMGRWDTESKVKNLYSNPVLSDSFLCKCEHLPEDRSYYSNSSWCNKCKCYVDLPKNFH